MVRPEVGWLQATSASQPNMVAALQWFTTLITSDLIEVLTLDRPAAILAGRLRALQPVPPTGARRKGTKPEQRAGWILDIQIASCVWTHGYQIATDNRHDFHALSKLITTLYPDVPPLAVTGSPAT